MCSFFNCCKSFNCKLRKKAEKCGKLVLYNDPFVKQHKNNYKLLRKIHYEEQVRRNFIKLNIIDAEYDDWRGEIVRWFNK